MLCTIAIHFTKIPLLIKNSHYGHLMEKKNEDKSNFYSNLKKKWNANNLLLFLLYKFWWYAKCSPLKQVLKSEPSKTRKLLYIGLPLQCCSCLNSLVPSFTISLFIVYYPDHIPGLCLYNSVAVHIQTEQSWWNQQVWLCAQLREVGYPSLEAKTK